MRYSLLVLCLFALTGCKSQEESAEAPPKLAPLAAASAKEQALAAANEGELGQALVLVQRGLLDEPKNGDLLLLAGGLLVHQASEQETGGQPEQAAESLKEGLAHLETLVDQEGPLQPQAETLLAIGYYHQAEQHAAKDQSEQSLASLQKAFDYGFDQFDQLQAEAWANLRENSEFQKLVDQQQGQLAARWNQEAEQKLADFEPFPFDFELQTIEGESISKKQFDGEVLVVDIWGTWCPPCRQEIPHFVQLHEKFSDDGLTLVGLNYESGTSEEAIEAIREFESQNIEIPYALALGTEQVQEQVPNFEGFPTTLFIDRSGTVRLKLVGYHPYEQLEAIVKQLLSESS